MNKYRVTEKQAQWTFHLYEVEAESKAGAIEVVNSGDVDSYDCEYGDYFGDCSHEVELLEEGEQPVSLQLCKAAPELLSACRELIDRLDIVRLRGYIGHPLVTRLRAAIAKAEGRDA